MASLFKRLFSSGGTQTASVQVAEPSAEAPVVEETIEQAASQYQEAELPPPSEEELKEFLYKHFLDGAKPAEIPQAQEWSAANSLGASAELAPAITSEEFDLPSPEEPRSSNQVSTEEADAAKVRVGDSTETESFVDGILAPAQDEIPATEDVVAISNPETIPQAEADSDFASDDEDVRLVTASSASEDEMMAEIEVDSMALDSPEVAAAFADERVARSLPPTLTEIPEALRPTLTDVIAESENAETGDDEGTPAPSLESTESLAGPARIDSSEWALEEALGNHKQWLDSRGLEGKKANLRAAKLEGTELISANLRHADLQDANLKAADLLLADLRSACMVRANLQDSCLVGANLEGANLEGASLESAMGLVPRQLAGTNLREASLPTQIAEFGAEAGFAKASETSARMFGAVILASLVSCLMIWKTTDVQLVSDSAVLPFLHSPTAAAALPTAEIYLIAPVLLLCIYLLFQYHLQQLWDTVLELPAIFPDGRALGEKQPRIITGLLRLHFHWMNQDAPSTRLIEKSVSAMLAYWIVPIVLVLFWGRYLTLQEIHGTILHEALVMAAVGVGIYATTKIGRPQDRWVASGQTKKVFAEKLRQVNPATFLMILFVVMTFLSVGTIAGVPHGKDRAPQFASSSTRRWAPAVLWSLGYDPYADLTEATLSTKPGNWRADLTESSDELSEVKGARLNESHFRYAQAYGIFLANAHLWRSDFYGAFLSEADLRGADFGQADLRLAILDRAKMSHTNFDRAQLGGANLARADLRGANLSYSSLINANLVDARLDGASLYGAHLSSANMVRANMQKADLRDAQLDGVDLEHADMQQAYLWSAKLPNARMVNAQLATAIFIDADLSGADLRGAQFNGTVLNGANLQNANLDGADLRGALQLGAAQVCSAKSRQGTTLDDALQKLVDAQCGSGHPADASAVKNGATTSAPTVP
ncbi:MAG: pentapeptide repeat-containing protein [Candidatus Acidiferrales bacterium]